MNGPIMFGAALILLVIACLAEHFVKNGPLQSYTGWAKVGLISLRVFIGVLACIVLLSTPRWLDDGECRPDPEGQYPVADCN